MPTPEYHPPDDRNDWPEPIVKAYYLALGMLLQEYANAESAFRFIIDRYASGLLAEDVNQATPPTEFWARTQRQVEVVRALVGQRSAANMSETIKMLLRIADRTPNERQIAHDALLQFSHIAQLRNRIVHSGASPAYHDQWLFYTSDALQARERHKARAFVFTIEDLENMTVDLRSIRLRIGVATLTDTPGFAAFADEHNAFDPWLYAPIQPISLVQSNSEHPTRYLRPLSPFEAQFSVAASYPISHGGPLVYSGKPRGGKSS